METKHIQVKTQVLKYCGNDTEKQEFLDKLKISHL